MGLKDNPKLKWFLSSLATFAGILLIVYFVPFGEIARAVKEISPSHLFAALTLYGLSYLFRTFRWKYYYPRAPLGGLFFTTAVNTFLNNLLPARLGELSIFALLRRYDSELKTTVGKFLKVRLLDGFALLTFLTFAVVSIKLSPSWGFFIALLVYPSGIFISRLLPLPKKVPTLKLELVPFFLSLGALLSKLLAVYLVLENLGLDFLRFTVGFLGGELSTIMPIHSVAGLGSYETGFSLALKLFLGESFGEGFKVGFLSHAFLLFGSTLFGLLSLPFALRFLK